MNSGKQLASRKVKVSEPLTVQLSEDWQNRSLVILMVASLRAMFRSLQELEALSFDNSTINISAHPVASLLSLRLSSPAPASAR